MPLLAPSSKHADPALLRARTVLRVVLGVVAFAACGDDPSELIGGNGGRRPLGRPASTTDGSGISGGGDNGGSNPTPAPPDTTPVGTGLYAAELKHCVDVTNAYREAIGLPALARSGTLEAFAAKAAASDSQSQKPHGYFLQTRGGGVAFAENAVPGWPMKSTGVTGIIDEGLKMMWDEGPGGGHHDNMASTRYTQLGCGVQVTAKKEVWVVQDYR